MRNPKNGRYERRRWTPSSSAFGGRRGRQAYDYYAFIPDRIAGFEPKLPADVAAVTTDAEVAVRELNAEAPRLGALEPLARQLLRAEAVASSRIEGLEMSHRRLARAAFAPEEADANARTVVGNVRAMEAAIALGTRRSELRVPDIRALHRILFRGTPFEVIGGRLRRTQNWIGGSEDGPRNAEFVPPNEELVEPFLEDLCAFMNRDDLPTIAAAAIAHAQFETIHPFADGNGRVGRCLIHVMLRRRGLAPSYVPPISLILATNQSAYVRGLTSYRDYTEEGVAGWVAVFSQATRTSAREAEGLERDMELLQDSWRSRAAVRRRGSAADKIVATLPAQPVLDVKTAAQEAGVVYEAARLAMAQLEGAGIVRQIGSKRRDRLFEAPEVFALLDGLERRLALPQRGTRPARPVPRDRLAARIVR